MWQPTVERIFQLTDLEIPPQNYAVFLARIVDSFTKLVLQHHGVTNLDEVVEEYKRKLKEENPGKPDEELFDVLPSPLALGFSGQLRFEPPEFSDRVQNRIYRTRKHIEDMFYPYSGGTAILLEDYQQQLASIVELVTKELDKRYPDRKGRLLNGWFRYGQWSKAIREYHNRVACLVGIDKERQNVRKFLSGFRFALHLHSEATDMIETDVTLRDYGSVSNDSGDMGFMLIIPAISIKAKTLHGTLELPQTVVDTLGHVVDGLYLAKDVEYKQHYVRR